jgi:hypothetical protein
MPRSPAGVTVVPLAQQRLRPPPELGAVEKAIFAELVGSVAPDHFLAGDLPLVAAYAEAIATHREALRHLRSEGLVGLDGRPSVWGPIQERALSQMVRLSLRLRLAPASRTRAKVAPSGPVSYYDRMKLLEHNADGGT